MVTARVMKNARNFLLRQHDSVIIDLHPIPRKSDYSSSEKNNTNKCKAYHNNHDGEKNNDYHII